MILWNGYKLRTEGVFIISKEVSTFYLEKKKPRDVNKILTHIISVSNFFSGSEFGKLNLVILGLRNM